MQNGLSPIRRYRLENDVTLVALAKRLGISHASLSRIERGKQRISFELIAALHRETGGQISPNDFLRGRPDAV